MLLSSHLTRNYFRWQAKEVERSSIKQRIEVEISVLPLLLLDHVVVQRK